MAVQKSGPASLARDRESVGGTLELQGRHLRFRPQRGDAQRDQITIEVRDIRRLHSVWTKVLGLIPLAPNGLDVEMHNREVFHFTVRGRKAWITEIESVFDETRRN